MASVIVGQPVHLQTELGAGGQSRLDSSNLEPRAAPVTRRRKRQGTRPQSIQTSYNELYPNSEPPHGTQTPSTSSYPAVADLSLLQRSASVQQTYLGQNPPYRLDQQNHVATPTYSSSQATGSGFYTPTHLATPVHIGGSAYSTPYSVGPSPYFAYPGSAPFVQPVYAHENGQAYPGASYHTYPRGPTEDAYLPTGYAPAHHRYSLGNASYLHLPQSPSPLPPFASSSKVIPSFPLVAVDTGSSSSSLGRQGPTDRKHDRRRLVQSHSLDLGSHMDNMRWDRQTVQHGAGRELPPFPETGRLHERTASVSTVSTSGPSTVSRHIDHTASNGLDAKPNRNGTTSTTRQRSLSDLSHSAKAPARRLEIRCSMTEGRRLVFPDTNPSVAVVPDGESSDGTGCKDSRSVVEQASTSSPDRKQRHRRARTLVVPNLRILEDGTAVVEPQAILQSDLEWLRHDVSPPATRASVEMEKDSEDENNPDVLRELGIATPERIKAEPSDEAGSAKKRKRLETIGNSKVSAADVAALPTSPTKKRGQPSALAVPKGRVNSNRTFGRLAIKEELALHFLGVESLSNSAYGSLTNDAVEAVAPSGSGGCPEKPKVELPVSPSPPCDEPLEFNNAVSMLAPDWPDASYPWNQELLWQQKRQQGHATTKKEQNAISLEHYLATPSDEEQSDADSRIALVRHLRSRGKTSKTSSDAREAVRHARQGGKTPLERDLDIRTRLPIISPADEAGCLCGGSNEEGGGMVCCDGCSAWYHLSCCGIETEDELEDQWFCRRCDPRETPGRTLRITDSPPEPVGIPVTPKLRQVLGPTFSATDETTRSYHAHTSDAALAPSPTFSPGARFPISLMDTPALYASPRVTSGSSVTSKFATPGTPLIQSKARIVSYAEHYNVCQTPGAPDSDYKKIYSTPKFEDFFENGVMQSGSTPVPRNPGSPTPINKPRLSGMGLPGFTTPTSSQNFLRSLQIGTNGSTPALEFLPSSVGGSSHSSFPISPVLSADRIKYPSVITDSISPSPYREHKRQVSFGARATSFSASASHLRDSVTFEGTEKGPLDLGGELKAPPYNRYAS